TFLADIPTILVIHLNREQGADGRLVFERVALLSANLMENASLIEENTPAPGRAHDALAEPAAVGQIALFLDRLASFGPEEGPEFIEVGGRPLDLFGIDQGAPLPAANPVAAPAISALIAGLIEIDDLKRED